ncbi:hypothetical protein BC938DRAFT_471185 [Jimgerdemannia flammicorona]|uniref:Protein PNS1 n=1 Tax=Jimgerdemannia flammicorona TaxID=994334 RepID=A0A433Q8R5_9FUNG|nr:hypothetical protein BC938DRAFT_471185 [Jimgerdemannia flammicorona]
MGIILIGAITALFSYAYVEWVKPTFNAGGNYTVVLVLICFLLGIMMATIVANVIDSGVATTFVALAEDPEALRRTKPELYQRIVQTWPQIAVGV